MGATASCISQSAENSDVYVANNTQPSIAWLHTNKTQRASQSYTTKDLDKEVGRVQNERSEYELKELKRKPQRMEQTRRSQAQEQATPEKIETPLIVVKEEVEPKPVQAIRPRRQQRSQVIRQSQPSQLHENLNIRKSPKQERKLPLPKRYKPTVMPKSIVSTESDRDWILPFQSLKELPTYTRNPTLDSIWTIQFQGLEQESEEELLYTPTMSEVESDAEIPEVGTLPVNVNPALSSMWTAQFAKRRPEPEEKETKRRTANPSLDQMWAMQFMKRSTSELVEHSVSETEEEEMALCLDRFEACSVITLSDVPSDVSSLYEPYEDTILTDFKTYNYCLLDDEGKETRVDVKILKDLSQSLLKRNGLGPSENTAAKILFGIDPAIQIQRVYDHGEDLWIVNEHVELNLKDVLGENEYPELPLLAKIFVTSELVRKLSDLHDQGVYMKNLGSGSVLLAPDGRVCLTNFLESALQKLKHKLVAGNGDFLETQQTNPLSTSKLRQKDVYRLGQLIARLFVGSQIQQMIRNGDGLSDIESMLQAEGVPQPIVEITRQCLSSRQEVVHMSDILSSSDLREYDLKAGAKELRRYAEQMKARDVRPVTGCHLLEPL